MYARIYMFVYTHMYIHTALSGNTLRRGGRRVPKKIDSCQLFTRGVALDDLERFCRVKDRVNPRPSVKTPSEEGAALS